MLIQTDRQNLKKLIEQYDYDFQYLKPSPQVMNVRQSQTDIFYWKDNEKKVKGRRRIYYSVKYDEQEQKAIKDVQQKMPKKGVFMTFSRELILKHLHVQKFSLQGTLQRLLDLQKFYYSSITQLNQHTIQNLKKGFIYSFGYTKTYRPILILRVDKVSNNMEIEQIFNTIYFLMLVICKYKMQPYHSEKYVIIIDLNNMNISQIPYPRIYSCLTKLALYSCGFTDQNFVVNASGIWAVWTFIKTFLPQYAVKKIVFLDDKSKLLEHIDPQQLQQRYGGTKTNIQEEQYWPPIASNKCSKNSLQKSMFSTRSETDFYSNYAFNKYLSKLPLAKEHHVVGFPPVKFTELVSIKQSQMWIIQKNKIIKSQLLPYL